MRIQIVCEIQYNQQFQLEKFAETGNALKSTIAHLAKKKSFLRTGVMESKSKIKFRNVKRVPLRFDNPTQNRRSMESKSVISSISGHLFVHNV
jgi:hypothetical protein